MSVVNLDKSQLICRYKRQSGFLKHFIKGKGSTLGCVISNSGASQSLRPNGITSVVGLEAQLT